MSNLKRKVLTALAILAIPIIAISYGCKKSSVVEMNFSQEELEKARIEAEQRDKVPAEKTVNVVVERKEPIHEDSQKTVSGEYRPVVIEAVNMTASNPAVVTLDAENGIMMKSYCELMMENVELPFVPKSITIEGKGDVAKNIPPKFSLIMFNERGNALRPWGEDGICSGTEYVRMYRNVWYLPENPILVGKYKISLYYLNNNEGIEPGDKEDRNLYIKKIEFHP